MLHTLGDSHCDFTFRGLPASIHRIGPVTMKRVGNPAEPLLNDACARIGLRPGDTLVLCFGEIDVRCWVHVHLARRKDGNLRAMLAEWVDAYLDKAASLPARTAILGVPPPSPASRIYQTPEFPVNGTDAERVLYTAEMNSLLAAGAAARGLPFIDLSRAAGPDGMLPPERCDAQGIHVDDPALVLDILMKSGIMEGK